MRVVGSGIVASVGFAGAIVVAACSAADPVVRPVVPIEVDARAGSDAACTNGGALVFEGGCRSTWLCAGAGSVGLTCALTDAGTRCVCTDEADSGAPFAPDAAACSEAGAAPAIARAACGWSVP